MDPESYQAAEAALHLAIASYGCVANGLVSANIDIIEEVDMLAKKSIRIMKKLKGHLSDEVLLGLDTLITVVFTKNYHETKCIFEDHLSDAIRYQGIDGEITGYAHFHLGRLHMQISCALTCNDAESVYNYLNLIIKKH